VNSESHELKKQKAKMARSKLVALLRAELTTHRSQKEPLKPKNYKEEPYVPNSRVKA
jgi:hypothetical protein